MKSHRKKNQKFTLPNEKYATSRGPPSSSEAMAQQKTAVPPRTSRMITAQDHTEHEIVER